MGPRHKLTAALGKGRLGQGVEPGGGGGRRGEGGGGGRRGEGGGGGRKGEEGGSWWEEGGEGRKELIKGGSPKECQHRVKKACHN